METRDSVDLPISLPTAVEIDAEDLPAAVDRRAFLMRSAAIGAAAVLTGRSVSAQEVKAKASAEAAQPKRRLSTDLSPELEVVKKAKGPVMTTLEEFYKVGPGPSSSHTIGPMRITYDFYQRCTKLPAGSAREGHGIQGPSLRQPEFDRQGTRDRAGGACRHRRQGARHRRAGVPRRAGREPESELSREARRQDDGRLARGHRLRLAHRAVSAPQHDDVQADGGRRRAARARVLLGRRRLHRMEGLSAAEEGTAEVPVRHDEGAPGARAEEQALDLADRHGERDGGLRQEQGRDRGVRRQDHRRRWSTS